jgi:hypothetical protein
MIPAVASTSCRVSVSSQLRREVKPPPEDGGKFEALALSIAFGNQTISPSGALYCGITSEETHGFASPPHGRFAFIVCNRRVKISAAENAS